MYLVNVLELVHMEDVGTISLKPSPRKRKLLLGLAAGLLLAELIRKIGTSFVRYICKVEALLYNPVYNALRSGDAHLGFGTDEVKYFDESVSPFAGFDERHKGGFGDLYDMLASDRKILYATPQLIPEPKGWQVLHEIKGLQFLFTGKVHGSELSIKPAALDKDNSEEMMQLAALTKPGPFSKRTIEFGNYFGIFDDGKLIAMTGQRLHVGKFTEISAVCTHPEYLGKGFASILIQHQLELILTAGQIPFLHVREDNHRAIALYERIGFAIQRPMNFYFLKRKLDSRRN